MDLFYFILLTSGAWLLTLLERITVGPRLGGSEARGGHDKGSSEEVDTHCERVSWGMFRWCLVFLFYFLSMLKSVGVVVWGWGGRR